MNNLFHEIAELLAGGQSVAVASIVRSSGSAPRHRGTRCGLLSDGRVLGTIGGGPLEAKTQAAGRESLVDGRARLLELRLDENHAAAAGMVCGGVVDITVVPWGPAQLPLAREAAATLDGGPAAALALTWDNGGSTWALALWRDGAWMGAELEAADLPELLHEGASGGKATILGDATAGTAVDILLHQRAPLLILGGGHVGRALARVAATADFAVTVVDDRPEFAAAERIPWAEWVLCRPFSGAVTEQAPDAGTFVVVCTRGHLSEADCTAQALRSHAPYVGVIGSRRKRDMLLRHLREQGIVEERLEALRMPVGLPIGAETPEEIAVSVLAELIQVRRRGTYPARGSRMSPRVPSPRAPTAWEPASHRATPDRRG